MLFRSIPHNKIHLDENNIGTPGIAHVFAFGYETESLDPTNWKSPILMKPSGVAFSDVVRESTELRQGHCSMGNAWHTSESPMGKAIYEKKLTLLCNSPNMTIGDVNLVILGSIDACERIRSNSIARACLGITEANRRLIVGAKNGYATILSESTKSTICDFGKKYLKEL